MTKISQSKNLNTNMESKQTNIFLNSLTESQNANIHKDMQNSTQTMTSLIF